MVEPDVKPSLIDAIEQRLIAVRPSIPEHVTLIAITKTQPVEVIRAAYALGLRHFGESRIQEAIAKQEQLTDLRDITWHFIGHLQSNKAAKALKRFQWIHSVDSLKLARRLNQLLSQEAVEGEHSPQVCLQVKMVPDPSKTGWAAEALRQDLDELATLEHLNIVGLMTIPPLGQSDADIYSIFTKARELASFIRQRNMPNLKMEHLSMGMSGDYPFAIKAGSTMVRLGRTLFGARA